MECTLATLIACFSWSNLYVDSGLQYHDGGEHYAYREHSALLTDDGELIHNVSSVTTFDTPSNPYGRLSIGYQFGPESLQWRIELSHVSSVATTKDRGVNSLAVSARWFPFR